MKNKIYVELYDLDANFAVLKLPERHYPGCLIQGDNLNGIYSAIVDAKQLFDSDPEEAKAALEDALEQLKWRVDRYNSLSFD
jgi:hypothetical protein